MFRYSETHCDGNHFFFLHILSRSLANCMLIDIVLLPLFKGFEHEIDIIRPELLKNASLYLCNCKFVKKIYLLNVRWKLSVAKKYARAAMFSDVKREILCIRTIQSGKKPWGYILDTTKKHPYMDTKTC